MKIAKNTYTNMAVMTLPWTPLIVGLSRGAYGRLEYTKVRFSRRDSLMSIAERRIR
jgi:hypothetical protein